MVGLIIDKLDFHKKSHMEGFPKFVHIRCSMCIATSPRHKAPLGTELNTDQQCVNKLIQTSQMQFLLDMHYHRVSRLGTNLDHRLLRAILYLESLLTFTKRTEPEDDQCFLYDRIQTRWFKCQQHYH